MRETAWTPREALSQAPGTISLPVTLAIELELSPSFISGLAVATGFSSEETLYFADGILCCISFPLHSRARGNVFLAIAKALLLYAPTQHSLLSYEVGAAFLRTGERWFQ